MSSLPKRPSVQLPQDLTGLIAGFVASNDDQRIGTLKNCMLVCQSFAREFRPHLFKTFYILDPDADSDDADTVGSRLCTHSNTLERYPEYRELVKEVVVQLYIDEEEEGSSLSESPHFPSWLKHLTSVTSVSLGSRFDDEPPVYGNIASEARSTLLQLCTRPSIFHLTFDQIRELPARIFHSAPNLTYLSLGSVTMKAEAITQDSIATSNNGHPLHLDIPHYDVGEEMGNAWSLDPLFKRVWKLSGGAGGPIVGAMLAMFMLLTRNTLRELDITIRGSGSDAGNGLSLLPASTIQIAKATLLERAVLKFERSASSSFVSDKPDLTSVLQLLTWSMLKPNKAGLKNLSSLVIEMHQIPSGCLERSAIAKEELWTDLDRILSDRSHFPNLQQLEVRLFVRDDEDPGLDEDERRLSADALLPSMSKEVATITIVVEDGW
ncbi:hypothetical protein BKA70DRAFT_1313836 [Coprinopsis sp. MPI-PUGE-AT-0042]|nr:hypothetical protein BKA70DRAFT_1313836 [Coprinopsis sp. MPI-PUGE-AT-0042]